MPILITSGSELKCSFGSSPSILKVNNKKRMMCGGTPAANILDHKPNENIKTFVMCKSLANPDVAKATAAAGVLTPMPCEPKTNTPWIPGSPSVDLGGKKVVSDACKVLCQYAGVIKVTSPAQTETLVQ